MAPSNFARALELSIFGFARVDAQLRLCDREGELLSFLPPVGEKIVDTPVFFGMDGEFAALRTGARQRLDLPGLRLAPEANPLSLTALYEAATDTFIIFAAADVGALDAERQLARERRKMQMLEDQALAAGRMIREQAALYRDIVETASDLVFRLGADLRVTFVNAVACRLLRQHEGEILGCAIDSTLGAPAGDGWRKKIDDQRDASFEQALHLPDGEIVWIWWSVRWVGDPAGAGFGVGEYQALGRDITEMRRLRVEAARGADEARQAAVMRERLRIAHDLHDTLVQSLVALVPQIRLIRKVLTSGDSLGAGDELNRAEKAARDGLSQARAALGDLRRATIAPDGFAAALENLARRFNERTGVAIVVEMDAGARAIAGEVADALHRIAEEALRNAEWHAHPTHVGIHVTTDDRVGLSMSIADDGRGFDPELTAAGHFGLIGMREQAELIGGKFALDTGAGRGANVRIELPPSAL
jgi:signal transduction histidine kinase